MVLKFTELHDQQPGIIAFMLKRSYAEIVSSDPEQWGPEEAKWEEFDREVFEHPETVGACVFLSWFDDRLVGFASYDPRGKPDFGIIGHNCILPTFRGRGFGKAQIREVIRRLYGMGVKTAKVSTMDHPLFVPAQRMYAACGFREVRRIASGKDVMETVIEYEKTPDNQAIGQTR